MEPYSPLYCRFNGFALGAFLASSSLDFASDRYGRMRTRVHEFISEIGLEATLPLRHVAYRANYSRIFDAIKSQLRTRSELLHDFMAIGSMAVLYVAGSALASHAQKRVLRDRWAPIVQRYGLAQVAFERFLQNVRRSARTRDAALQLSYAFGLVEGLIQPIEAEPDTCFVAMPFQRPFNHYFSTYYRPALARAGFRAIRAWGGVSSEGYFPFVGTLISRCGAVFAELGTLNPNVINEIGFAHGGNRQTFLIMRKQRREPPSNIAQLPIFQYSDAVPGWQLRDIPRLARFVRWMWQSYLGSLTTESVIHDAARELIRVLRIAKRPVSDELQALAGVREQRRLGC